MAFHQQSGLRKPVMENETGAQRLIGYVIDVGQEDKLIAIASGMFKRVPSHRFEVGINTTGQD